MILFAHIDTYIAYMKPLEFIKHLRANGQYTFTVAEAEEAFGTNRANTLNKLKRLKPDICSPAKGFYVIIPPEYRAFGCLPAEMFIDQLMAYWAEPYYVGYLSAAQYYGAAHQKPQSFQVVTTRSRRHIQCGRISIEFIKNKDTMAFPIKPFNTAAGIVSVATPETLMFDLVGSQQYAAGIDNIATVLAELTEHVEPSQLLKRFDGTYPVSSLQKLGFLFEFLSFPILSEAIYKALEGKKIHWVKLVPDQSYQVFERNKKWKVIVNTTVEADL